MEFKGTKGKWIVDHEESGFNKYHQLCTPISTKGFIGFCEIYGDDEESKANALLISKSPEMLEMLQKIHLKLTDSDTINYDDYEELEQLIKEATEL